MFIESEVLAREQAKYDKQLPEIAEDEADNEPFGETYVQKFIVGLSECREPAFDWLYSHVGEYIEKSVDAELLRAMACAWVKDQESVYKLVGTRFWQAMSEMAWVAHRNG